MRMDVMQAINAERAFQDRKWGDVAHNPHTQQEWLIIITEELGKVAQAINKRNERGYRAKLVTLAAVIVAALEQEYREQEILAPGETTAIPGKLLDAEYDISQGKVRLLVAGDDRSVEVFAELDEGGINLTGWKIGIGRGIMVSGVLDGLTNTIWKLSSWTWINQ